MTRILGPNGQPIRSDAPRAPLRARYDAALVSEETAAHWALADGLSARAANDPATRKRLRDRSRYETANNGYARGITKRVAEMVVGTGPRLMVQTPDRDLNRQVEGDFAAWTGAVCLAAKLRTMRMSRTTDGEAFALLTTNPKLPTAVQLDVSLVEADQVATPTLYWPTKRAVDGIIFDDHGNPAEYHVLKQHPGDTVWLYPPWDFYTEPAAYVIHWFVADRPGQARGVPEITAALPLFAQLRRYTLAALSAAEIAALFAAILKSNLPPDDSTVGLPPFDTQALQRGLMTALPDGYDFSQLRAEQPTTTYPQFKKEIINEAGSGMNVPSNVALGDSSGYNYSSAQLDRQWFGVSVDIDRDHAEKVILDRLFAAWFAEYRVATPLPAGQARLVDASPRSWHWDGMEHQDPAKEARAQTERLQNGTTTLAVESARGGYDWRELADQRAEERAYYATLGLPYPGDPAPPQTQTQPPDQAPAEPDGDGDAYPGGNGNGNGNGYRNGRPAAAPGRNGTATATATTLTARRLRGFNDNHDEQGRFAPGGGIDSHTTEAELAEHAEREGERLADHPDPVSQIAGTPHPNADAKEAAKWEKESRRDHADLLRDQAREKRDLERGHDRDAAKLDKEEARDRSKLDREHTKEKRELVRDHARDTLHEDETPTDRDERHQQERRDLAERHADEKRQLAEKYREEREGADHFRRGDVDEMHNRHREERADWVDSAVHEWHQEFGAYGQG